MKVKIVLPRGWPKSGPSQRPGWAFCTLHKDCEISLAGDHEEAWKPGQTVRVDLGEPPLHFPKLRELKWGAMKITLEVRTWKEAFQDLKKLQERFQKRKKKA
jgi:hypothetical protein